MEEMRAEFNIDIDVVDPESLWKTARADFLYRGNDEEEVGSWIGTVSEPDLSNCVIQLYDRELEPGSGVMVNASSATIIDPEKPSLRVVKTVTASTAHLTPSELDAINEAFGMERDGQIHRCLEEITHGGLHISPKCDGFIVRIPLPQTFSEIRDDMTAEMRTLVGMAIDQKAARLEFDRDEEEVQGITVHEH